MPESRAKRIEHQPDEPIIALAAKILAAVKSPILPAEAHGERAFWEGFITSHLKGRGERIVKDQ